MKKTNNTNDNFMIVADERRKPLLYLVSLSSFSSQPVSLNISIVIAVTADVNLYQSKNK